jgi:N,N'-diacetylchitobiose phosphorylase
MYTAVTKYILGLRLAFDGLVVDPSIPREWDGFSVRREWRGAVYNIEVRNPDHVSKGVVSVTLDGVALDAAAPIPVQPDGAEVAVVVTLG